MSNDVCPERSNGGPHCFHATAAPMQLPPSGAVVFQSVCCFCAPSYMQFVIYLHPSAQPEDVIAQQMSHGRLVRIEQAPSQRPKLFTV